MASDLQSFRENRTKLRRDLAVNAILDACAAEHITLVELEEASKGYMDRWEAIGSSIASRRQEVMYNARAKYAAKVRWERSKAFLTSHIDRKEKVAQTFGAGVNVDLGESLVDREMPEKTYDEEVN